ncbi:ATP-binding cassette domain-containing protein [Rhodobacteraceae bacterium RKSG542]|uniref:ABC transporter ATP-binding protein/permease n=1 Tax=Pseudovibrio flavus TaxID=2529854 RepID=UPI0012BCEFC3|nr:ATP-binding cassette domain-containing protein [Pseudovibrio flavus]MTI17113.1 ATP-binding cassette domain-containing protein [Pseudovibrio flavus]
MSGSEQSSPQPNKKTLQKRIIAPVSAELRKAGVLSVLSGLIWPLQALLIAWTVSGWALGTTDFSATVTAAIGLVGLGAVKAQLEKTAGFWLFEAADKVITIERQNLLQREARQPSSAGSAEIAAIVVQKLPMLQPWITRYHVAMLRVYVLPIVYLVLTFTFSWVIGLVLLVAGPLIPVFMALVGMAAEEASRKQVIEIGSINSMLMERLSAMTDIRLLGATDRAIDDFQNRADTLREKTMAILKVAFLSSTVLELFAALGVAMVAVFVGFTLLGEIQFGTWGEPLSLFGGLFLLLLAPDYFQPLRDLAAAWHDRASGLAVVEELEALDRAERTSFVGRAESVEPMSGDIQITLSGASMMRSGAELPLPNLSIGQGEAVALVGPSGAGKTSTLFALAGLLPLHSGDLTVCGQRLGEDNADAWRARVALVLQHPHFADTILADYLDPNEQKQDPWPVLRLTHASEIVEHLPDGLHTSLGETGGGVSGGEARRLMLARALMRNPEVLLADEPTADLDPETAALIIDSLVHLKERGCTLIVASHDPALIAAMDRVVEVAA